MATTLLIKQHMEDKARSAVLHIITCMGNYKFKTPKLADFSLPSHRIIKSLNALGWKRPLEVI